MSTAMTDQDLKKLGWQRLIPEPRNYGGRANHPLISIYPKGLFRFNRLASKMIDSDYVEIWYSEQEHLLAFRSVSDLKPGVFRLGPRESGAREFTSKMVAVMLQSQGLATSVLSGIPEKRGDLIVLDIKASE